MIKVFLAAVLMTVLSGCAAGVSTRGGTSFGIGVAPVPPVIYQRPVYRRPWGWGGPRYYRGRYLHGR
jgi:hypothetical protein